MQIRTKEVVVIKIIDTNRILSVLLLFLLYSGICIGQQSSNIKKLLKEVKDASYYDSTLLFTRGEKLMSQYNENAIRSEVFLYYGNYYYYTQRLEKAKSYFELSLREALSAKSRHLEMLSKIRLAFVEYDNGNHFSAEKKLNDILEVSRKENDYENVAETLNLLAIIKEAVSNTKEAAELYYEGLSISEKNNLEYYKAVFRNNLGLIKLYSGQVEEAKKDFEEGLVIAQKDNHLRIANHLKMNLCLTYVRLDKPEKSYSLFEEVIEYSKKNNLPVEMASNYVNLGSAILTAGLPETALAYFDSAISAVSKYELYSAMVRGYFGKVEAFLSMNNVKEAEKNIEIIDKLIAYDENLNDKAHFYFLRYRVEFSKNNYKEALDNYVNYTLLNDSLNSNMNAKTIEELQYNYRVQLKEAELEKERSKIILLEIRNQKDRFLKWLIAGIGLLVVVISLAFFYNRYLRNIRKKQEQFSKMLIENIEEERKRISMDLHDDIGQNLSIIKSKVIKSGSDKANDLENDLSMLIEQTREISRNLYPSNIEKIGISRAVAALMESLQSVKGLECSYEICEEVLELPIKIQTNLFRIIQECINNTIKHSGASGLKITIQEKNKEFVMLYMDNGSGLKSKKYSSGIGLLSIHERARIIKGSVDIDDKNESGFRLTLKFKYP